MASANDPPAVLRHTTASEVAALVRAYRIARRAAQQLTSALRAAGLGPDRATVTPTLTDDARPLLVVNLTEPPAHRSAWCAGWLDATAATRAGCDPPHPHDRARYIDPGRAA